MMALRRICVLGILFCAGFLLASCERPKSVPIENVHVTPVTGADIQRAVHDSGAKAVLVNVWATWCAPCREEFPGVVRVARQYQGQGLKVLLVSADDDSDMAPVKKFLAAEGVDFPAYIKAEKDQAFIDALNKQSTLDKQWDGALPATFIYDATGKLHDFWEGEATFSVFQQKVVEVLGKQAKSTGGGL
jgi:thiol-disulfide isomerase/thioredoxin